MTKSSVSERDEVVAAVREPRPFLYLEPARLPLTGAVDPIGLERLETTVSSTIPLLVRSLVDYTIARQNRRASERRNPQPIQVSVLNRRRRAARTWLLAILAGRTDASPRHAAATQWIPVLTGTGPDLARSLRPARELIEYLRGAITACLFDAPRANLLRDARALHVLETTLSAHLAGLLECARTNAPAQ